MSKWIDLILDLHLPINHGSLLTCCLLNRLFVFPCLSWIPLQVKTAILETQNSKIERIQYPLKLAYAVTIHKSQGLTLPKAVIDLGNKETCNGLSFVALSRVKRLQNLYLIPFDYTRISTIQLSQDMIHHDKDTKLLIEQTIQHYRNRNIS